MNRIEMATNQNAVKTIKPLEIARAQAPGAA